MATAQATGWEAVRRVLRRYLSLIALGIVLLLVYILYTLPPHVKTDISSALQGLRGGATGGLMLAYTGTLLLVGAQVYTLVKRSGDPRYPQKVGGVARWLNLHIAMSVMGFVFVAIHAGFPFKFQSADLADKGYAGLATWLLLIVTISGVFGRYLYNRLPAMRRPFRLWKETHIIVTALLFLFALIHILVQALR